MQNIVIGHTTPAGSIRSRPGLTNSTGLYRLDLGYEEADPLFFFDLSRNVAVDYVIIGEFEDTRQLKSPQGIIRTFINSLPGEPYALLEPIPVKIETVGDGDYIASFDEANIAISGETYQEAFQNLIAEILNSFENFIREEGNLGPEPSRQLRILKRYLKSQQ